MRVWHSSVRCCFAASARFAASSCLASLLEPRRVYLFAPVLVSSEPIDQRHAHLTIAREVHLHILVAEADDRVDDGSLKEVVAEHMKRGTLLTEDIFQSKVDIARRRQIVDCLMSLGAYHAVEIEIEMIGDKGEVVAQADHHPSDIAVEGDVIKRRALLLHPHTENGKTAVEPVAEALGHGSLQAPLLRVVEVEKLVLHGQPVVALVRCLREVVIGVVEPCHELVFVVQHIDQLCLIVA